MVRRCTDGTGVANTVNLRVIVPAGLSASRGTRAIVAVPLFLHEEGLCGQGLRDDHGGAGRDVMDPLLEDVIDKCGLTQELAQELGPGHVLFIASRRWCIIQNTKNGVEKK